MELVGVLITGFVLLLVIVFALAWMVADLARDVATIAKSCGKCAEGRIRQFERDNP